MPYVTKDRRSKILLGHTGRVEPRQIDTAGDLNFAITHLIIKYTEQKGLSYQTINDVVGALTLASSEFQRRIVFPYENKKKRENGDVYPKRFRQ